MAVDRTVSKGIAVFKQLGLRYIISVPCKNLSPIIAEIEDDEDITLIPATREEEGVGIAAGLALGGHKPLIMMQNSGLGNCINALQSLTVLYRLPLLFIISHRGGLGEKIIGQVPMGQVTEPLLATMGFPFYHLREDKDVDLIKKAMEFSIVAERPVFLLGEPGFWSS